MRRVVGPGGALVTMLVLGACADDPAGGVGGDSGGESTAVDSAVDPGQSALVLNFEDEAGPGGALTWFRNSGTAPVSARTVTGGGGVATGAAGHPTGAALQLPEYSANDPGYAVVRVTTSGADDALSPGSEPFSFGADFTLDADSSGTNADNGDNLVQRGLFDAPGQYKIQVDGGKASCRVMGSAGDVTVEAATRVLPGRWYRLWVHPSRRHGDTRARGDRRRRIGQLQLGLGQRIDRVGPPAAPDAVVGRREAERRRDSRTLRDRPVQRHRRRGVLPASRVTDLHPMTTDPTIGLRSHAPRAAVGWVRDAQPVVPPHPDAPPARIGVPRAARTTSGAPDPR